jgi:cytohesin
MSTTNCDDRDIENYTKDFFAAISSDAGPNLDTVERYLRDVPALVHRVDSQHRTALHVACGARHADVDVIRALLRHQPDVNAKDMNACTPIHLCSNNEVIDLLAVQPSCNINAVDDDGYTALYKRILDGDIPSMVSLLNHGADPMKREPSFLQNSLHAAAGVASVDLLVAMLRHTTVPLRLCEADINGNTSLHMSCASERVQYVVKAVPFILECAPQAGRQANRDGITPLHFVCANMTLCLGEEISRMEDELKEGGGVDTPYTAAVAEPLVQFLLDVGADPNAQDRDGCTPLIIACARREWEICRLLLKAGGDLNLPCAMNSQLLVGNFDIHEALAQLKHSIKRESRPSSPEHKHRVKKSDSKSALDADDSADPMLMDPAMNPAMEMDCTANDLTPPNIRYALYSAISTAQTPVTNASSAHGGDGGGGVRDRCMNCGQEFNELSSHSSLKTSSSRSVSSAGVSTGSEKSDSGKSIAGMFGFASLRGSGNGKGKRYNCGHCGRVVCRACVGQALRREEWNTLPEFVAKVCIDANRGRIRLCTVCDRVLSDKNASEDPT